jgi:hypothetical protein
MQVHKLTVACGSYTTKEAYIYIVIISQLQASFGE